MATDKDDPIDLPPSAVYDPFLDPLQLTHEEKLRTTALMLAIKYYVDTICADADLYRVMRDAGTNFQPASEERVIDIASKFAGFILQGEIKVRLAPDKEDAEPLADSAASETGGEP